ncbi:MAG: type IV pilus modification PilV family protein [Patescibacteria group bacterium]
MDFKTIKNSQEGFTIIELLVACLVIVVGLLSVVSMIVNAFTATMPLSANLIASYLAQEGFEVVRRIRDENFNERYSSGSDEDWYWAEGLIAEDEPSNTGSVHYDSQQLGGKEGEKLTIEDDTNLFGYGPGEETDFIREITVEKKEHTYKDGQTTEYLLVTAKISWTEKGEPKKHEASTKLFNWY